MFTCMHSDTAEQNGTKCSQMYRYEISDFSCKFLFKLKKCSTWFKLQIHHHLNHNIIVYFP